MASIINVSVDLSKIDKSKIIEGKKGGKYYNLTISVNDEKDQYGNDVSVTDSQTKEQRDAKEKKTYLGNGRVIWQSKYEQKPEDYKKSVEAKSDALDDLGF